MPPTAEGRGATGQARKGALRVRFDRSVKLEFHGSELPSDAGLLPCRELDAVRGLTAMAEKLLDDWRTGRDTRHSMVALMRQPALANRWTRDTVHDTKRTE
jgi:hypothetical protein